MTRLPRDLAFTDYPASVSRPSVPALYYGVRMDLGSANGFGESLAVKLAAFASDGVLFSNPNGSLTVPKVGALTPAIEDLAAEVDVQGWMEWRSFLGQVQTNEVRKIGVFARAALASPASSTLVNRYAAFQDVSTAILFYAQGLGTPGTFRFKLARYDGSTNAEIQLGATATLLEYDDGLRKPMGMRLVVVDDDTFEVTVRAQVRATAFEQPLIQTSALAGNRSTAQLGVEVGEVGDGRAMARLARNVLHGALPWVSETAAGAKNLTDNGDPINVDADAMPTSLEAGQRLATALFRNHLSTGYDSGPLPSYRAGTYVIEWDGGAVTWEVAGDGGSLTQPTGGRAEFVVTTPSAAGVHLSITALDSSNPPTGIRVYFESAGDPRTAGTFDPTAIGELATFPRVLRWGDALRVDENVAEDFADLPGDGYLFWGSTGGVPIGRIIELATAYNRDLWITVPAALTSAARVALLERIRDELPIGLTVYLELGHEAWIPAYAEDGGNPGVYLPVAGASVAALAAWLEGNDATAHGSIVDGQVIGTPLDADPDTAQRMGYGVLAQALFDDAAGVFSGADLDRVRFVVSSQASDTDATDDVLTFATRAQAVSIAVQVPDRDASSIDLTQSAADIVADLVTEAANTKALVAAQRAKVRDEHGLALVSHGLGVRLDPSDATELGNALDATLHADAEAMFEGILDDWQEESDEALAIVDTGHLFGSVADGVRGLRRYVGHLTSAATMAAGFEAVAENALATGTGTTQGLLQTAGAQATPGYQVIEAVDWTTIFEVTLSGANYPTGVDACGILGDYIGAAGSGAVYAGFCTRFAVYDPDTGAPYWEDDWTERIDSLLAPRPLLGGLATGLDYGSMLPGDVCGYGLSRADPFVLTYDASGEGVQHANADHPGFEVYQRRPDDLKSQHRRGTFLFELSGADGDVGIVVRANHVPATVILNGPGAFLHYRAVVNRTGTTFEGRVYRRGLDNIEVLLATFDASSLSLAATFTLALDCYDQRSQMVNGPVVLAVSLNSSPASLTLEDVEGVTTLGTNQKLVDRSAQRVPSGYEGFYLTGSTGIRACRAFEQLTLTNEKEIPIEDVAGIAWPTEASGATQTLDLGPAWGATRTLTGRSAVSRQRSGRTRRGSLQSQVRDVWTLTGVVTKAERDALRSKFVTVGGEQAFTLRGPSDVFEAFGSQPVRFLANSFRSIRVPSTAADPRYRVEFAVGVTL